MADTWFIVLLTLKHIAKNAHAKTQLEGEKQLAQELRTNHSQLDMYYKNDKSFVSEVKLCLQCS